MATFAELHQDAHKRGNIRKALQTVAFIARRSELAEVPTSLFAGGTITDLREAGFTPVGMVTVDGFNFEREDSNSEVQSHGFMSATREDLESSTRTVTFTAQEIGKRVIRELTNGVRLDDAQVEDGEVVIMNPEAPENDEWCLIVIAYDGVQGNDYLDAKILPTIKVQTVSGEQWGGDSERNREITARVYVDDELGVPEIDVMGGEAFLRNAEELGYGVRDNGEGGEEGN